MAEHRRDRVAHLVQAKLAELLVRDARDPRLQGVTITGVRMTADLRIARVYYRILPDTGAPTEIARALERATPFLRGRVGRTLGMRVTPELRFEFDRLPDTARRLEELLAGGGAPKPDEPGEGE